MANKESKGSSTIPAILDNRDGTFSVYRCYDKEEPEGYRGIQMKFHGLKTRGQAIEMADRIQYGKKNAV